MGAAERPVYAKYSAYCVSCSVPAHCSCMMEYVDVANRGGGSSGFAIAATGQGTNVHTHKAC